MANLWSLLKRLTGDSPESWARKLNKKKDYRALAAVYNSQDYSEAFQKWPKKRIADGFLRQAGAEAVDAVIEELGTDGAGSIDLATLLVAIGDPKAVPILKKKLDRGDFSAYGSESDIRAFVGKHPQAAGEVESVQCELCGKTRPVTDTHGYEEDGKVKRFCVDTCWKRRGLVLKSGIGKDCPFYSEGMCEAGEGNNLCSLRVGSYATSCYVYGMFAGTASQRARP